MDFAQHLISYYRGERLEATLLTAFGVILSGLALAMWRHIDSSALLKGLFYPITFLAAFTVLVGGFGVYNNSQRLVSMPAQYAQNQTVFIEAEQKRFNGRSGVNAWWMPLKLLWAICLLIGVAMVFGSRSEFTHGIAIGVIVIGAAGFVIDGFAHQRAQIYTAALHSQ